MANDPRETEAIDHVDASNQKPGTADPVLEAHIVEEHVVGAPKSVAPTVVPTPVVVTSPQPTSPPAVARVPTKTSAPEVINLANDMAHILEGVKLPTRNTASESEKKSQTFDTALSIDPKSEEQKNAAHKELFQKARAITESLPSAVASAKDDVRALHTLKDDLQNVVRDKKISLVRAVALEEEKRYQKGSETEAVTSPQSKRTRSAILIAGLLVAIGCLAIGAVLYVMQERTPQNAITPSTGILFAEQTVPLTLDNLAPADVRREIGNARLSGGLTLGAILQIIPVTTSESALTPVSFGSFLERIGSGAPAELARSLSDDFFLGLHTVDENAPIIVVPVQSYERAFAAMLAWEKNINQDLSPIFTYVPPQTLDANGLPHERVFEDTVMNNYDVRVLRDDAGQVQLFYSFPTRNILIIAESPYSFTEVLSRLRADRRL